ncbi:energy transducer TonB [Xylella taiwanensis]|uniref:Protein TonB n=1 Tax=Xylella taiwanensis TaxID=1444770 RepID=A0ABS8TSW1_9GAMM|nr:energy transducer TonB [Xylella taiwanensis]MCD8456903.1 energy transducer TonB [Xylella taiwanensis]MCD8459315.1 energy transducer TonB [Xylella taiwanensis]MCD8461814.1 energy transducer TonB [Xylella taiwanensis]MCD8462153.1 energy transducer TonB [Xylella taiwanensis]MCD8465940.1 energy transducer TonB [Xylella taiwanensis]
MLQPKMSRTVPLSAPILLLLAILVACSKQDDESAPTTDPQTTPTVQGTTSQSQNMAMDQLHEAATQALRDNRMYAPAGNNAVEYYLALREKQPQDPIVNSALTDLLPYTLIAAEQSINRKDFTEARRLVDLIEKVDPNAPAFPRLKQAVMGKMHTKKSESQEIGENNYKKQTSQQTRESVAEQRERVHQEITEFERPAPTKREVEQHTTQIGAPVAVPILIPPSTTTQGPTTAPVSTTAQTPPTSITAPATAQGPALTPIPVRAPVVATLHAISTPAPSYPTEALRAGISGEVVVEIKVGTDGSVTNARVVQSTPPRVFDREALHTVKSWKFEPVKAMVTTRRTLSFTPGN